MRRTIALARKEFLHILRDPRTLTVAIMMPLIMVLLFGYAIDTELKDLPVAFLDEDRTEQSRDLIAQLTGNEFILDVARLQNRNQIEPLFRDRSAYAAVVIPHDFGETLLEGGEAKVQVLIDGADGSSAATVQNYLNAAIRQANERMAAVPMPAPLDMRVRFLFNPQLESQTFIVPGLLAVVMMMICALLTSIAVAREKETGTLEQILTTPVRSVQVITGKVLPYILLATLDAALILALGLTVFGVPMRGSWLMLGVYSLEFLLIALALGLLVSTITSSQRVAMLLALMITLLPTIILSGFIFPIESMPTVLQWFTRIIPARYYIDVIRSLMLVGENWFPLEGGVMAGMAVLLLGMAVKRFSSRLE
ncbi:ABC transporter permease subunit [bacterium]|nr:ABC transporter permease subunit [bacterium]